jgi:hypothetical protein
MINSHLVRRNCGDRHPGVVNVDFQVGSVTAALRDDVENPDLPISKVQCMNGGATPFT